MDKPHIAQKSPIGVDLVKGETYFWCSCGQSRNQPFCDGSHKGGPFSPLKYEATATEKKFLCACKQTANKPFCDGTHKSL
jgi:CDGSH-type Zn-finger protein